MRMPTRLAIFPQKILLVGFVEATEQAVEQHNADDQHAAEPPEADVEADLAADQGHE
jgi:hypothetical protein